MMLFRDKKKRLAAVVGGAIALVVTLVGCSVGGSQSSAGSETGKLTVWDYYTSSAPGWQTIMNKANAAFEKAHPGVKIDYVAQSGDNAAYTQLVTSTFLSKSGPDVMMLQPGWDGVLQFAPGLEPLDKYFSAGFKGQIAGFSDSALAGNTYGVPLGGGALVLMYNKALLAKGGVTKLPTSFAELTGDLKQLKGAGVQPLAGGISGGGDLSVWAMSYLFSGVGTPADATALAANKMKWTDPVVKDALSAWVSLWQNDYYPQSARSQDIGAGYNDFLGGKAAFGILPVAAMKAAADGIGADNIGALPSMGITQPAATYQPYGAVSVWSIPAYSAKKSLAAAYIQAVTSTDVQQELYTKLAWPPANKNVDLKVGVAAKVPAIGNILGELTGAKKTQLNVHQLLRITVATELKRQMQNVIDGTSSLNQALAAIQQVQDAAFK